MSKTLQPTRPVERRPVRLRRSTVLVTAAGLAAVAVTASTATAPVAPAAGPAAVTVTVTGGAGTVTQPVSGAVFAKSGQVVNLVAGTDPAASCLSVSSGAGAVLATQTAPAPGRATWTVPIATGPGDGVQTLTVRAVSGVTPAGTCSEAGGALNTPGVGSYVLDNTGPVVTASSSPPPSAFGWTGSVATVTFVGVDAGVGVGAAASPVTQSVTAESNIFGRSVNATIKDLLGNPGVGSITVFTDLTPPTISGSRAPATAGPSGWNTAPVTVSFGCSDGLSGIATCPVPTTLSADGATQSVTGTAVDKAGLRTSATVGAINIDRTPPSLTGTPTTAPNTAGWYRGDVTIGWDAADPVSGLARPVPDSVISGEGGGLTATATAGDVAGNSTQATSAAVRIDRTPPVTTLDAPADWVTADQRLTLAASDNLSGIAASTSSVDGGAPVQGSSVSVQGEGDHMLEYWSTDTAGNAEPHRTARVRIDRTAPTLTHSLAPAPNGAGWNRAPVTVTFACGDGLSGVVSCPAPHEVSTQGAGQAVTGTGTDAAGNQGLDTATVNLDGTDPTVAAAADRAPNGAGWFRAPVTVTFDCADALSGIAAGGCPAAEVLAEGAGRSATGTARDTAGNTASATVTGIDVDTTDPSLAGAPAAPAGPGGWYSDNVSVAWTCSDPLSGLDGPCPDPTVVSGEGEALSASATVTDRAGNATTTTVRDLRIDRSAPVTTAVLPPAAGGWYGGEVAVTLTAVDPLSGVARTHYRLDGGDLQTYAAPVAVKGTGRHTLTYWSVDVAGNTESTQEGHQVVVAIDDTRPTITGLVSPPANQNRWHRGPVSVSFDCRDEDSGVAACDPGVTLSDPGADQSVTGTAVDTAGNQAGVTVDQINIDPAPPTLVGRPTSDPDAAGWYRGDVTVAWDAADGLSGVDPADLPAPTVVTGEGADLTAGPAEVSDRAGNSTTASLTGLNIDRTAPSVSGKPTTAPGASGWYRADVTVAFSCSDALSGVATCPSDKVITGNGAGRSVTGEVARDRAGNVAAGVTVGGIDLDGQPPSTSSDNQCPAGHCQAGSADVVLTATDQEGLSGVKELHYAVNGGAEQVVAGATATLSVPLVAGVARLTYFAVDRAGNVEPANSVSLDGDEIAPSVTHTATPAANAQGWNNTDVTVTFAAKDDDLGSGVDPASVTAPVTVIDETAQQGRSIVGSATDLAGNRGTDTVVIRLDRTAPVIELQASPAAGPSGWRTAPVTVHFACTDALSGVAVCPDDVTLVANGSGQGVTRMASDLAGNTGSAAVSGIQIDREAPAVARVSVRDGALYPLGAVPAPVCTGTDSVSGIDSCTVTVTGPAGAGVGSYAFTAVATDVAGNSSTVRGSYRVVYRFDGFSPPVHDLRWFGSGVGFGVFRSGTTVPIRVQQKLVGGTPVQGGSPTFVTAVRASLALLGLTGPPSPPSMSAGQFRWDAASRTWEYLWDTRGLHPGYLYRVGATLDDGRTYYAYVVLV